MRQTDNNIVEELLEAQELMTKPEIQKTFRFEIEKMEGGFVSDITGKRKIHKDAYEIDEEVNLRRMFDSVPNDLYYLNIDFLTKTEYDERIGLLDAIKEEHLSVEQAKEQGIIEPADKFNPYKETTPEEFDIKNIKVDHSNCYSSGRLKSIDWRAYHKLLPLTNTERCNISGANPNTMYNAWTSALKNKASFHNKDTRVTFTILSKYYEAHTGIRTSSKDQIIKLKEDMLRTINELELMAKMSKGFVKAKDITNKLDEMKKHLI